MIPAAAGKFQTGGSWQTQFILSEVHLLYSNMYYAVIVTLLLFTFRFPLYHHGLSISLHFAFQSSRVDKDINPDSSNQLTINDLNVPNW